MRRRELIGGLAVVAAGWPRSSRGKQPAKVYRLAIVTNAGLANDWTTAKGAQFARYLRPFFKELRRQGFTDGQNLVTQVYSAEGRRDRYVEASQSAVRSTPDAILAVPGRIALTLKEITATVPIVTVTADPVAIGLAPRLARQGGNITGVVVVPGTELTTKRLQLLFDCIPEATKISLLAPRSVWETQPEAATHLLEAGRRLGVKIVPALLDPPINEAAFRQAFARLAQDRVNGVLVGDAAEHYHYPQLLAELAQNARLPSISPERIFAENGGLMSYGSDLPDMYRYLGSQVAEVLNGADPGTIPFYRMTKFELVINLKTAKVLGITVPRSLLARADDVIE